MFSIDLLCRPLSFFACFFLQFDTFVVVSSLTSFSLHFEINVSTMQWRTLALYQLLYSKVIMNYGLVFPCSTILVFVFVFSLEFLDKGESPWGPTTNCGSYFPASLLPLPQLQLGEWHLNISEVRSLYKLVWFNRHILKNFTIPAVSIPELQKGKLK